MTEHLDAADLAKYPRPQYRAVRVLPDGSVAAIRELLFTRAIVLGCTRDGWGSRFCFADRALADQRFAELQTEDDVPSGAVASRSFGRVGATNMQGTYVGIPNAPIARQASIQSLRTPTAGGIGPAN